MSVRSTERGEIHVCVACHHVACAVDAKWVVRLALLDEASSVRRAPSGVTLADFREGTFVAWDLGVMLGLPMVKESWILSRVSIGGHTLPMAIRTGRCLSVTRLEAFAPLPPSLFRTREKALSAMFPVELVGPMRGGVVFGARLEPTELWGRSEVDAALAALGDRAGTAIAALDASLGVNLDRSRTSA